jgi:hypothetical protein
MTIRNSNKLQILLQKRIKIQKVLKIFIKIIINNKIQRH